MSAIRRTVLSNGIKVITERMASSLSSSVGVWVRTGSRDEPERLGGISHFIEHMLFKGTGKRTPLDIAREIESVGGALNAFTGREQTCFYAKVLCGDLPLAIDLLSDIVINSRFDAKELDRERLVIMQEIKMVDDTPDDLVHDLFFDRFWSANAVGRPILGDLGSVGGFKRDDVVGYYEERYRPGSIIITAAGGVNHSEVVQLLEKKFVKSRFGKKKSRAVEGGKVSVKEEAPVSTPSTTVLKRDLEQVHLCLGVPSFAQCDPKRYSVYLLSTILGGGMSSRLFQEVREKRGLAYSVYSYLTLLRDAGSLVVYAGTSKKDFGKVVRLVMGEFRKLRTGVARRELKSAKEQLKGGILMGLESSDSRMTKLARDEIYFGRSIALKEVIASIEGVKGSHMEETAVELLSPKNVTMTVVGGVGRKDVPPGFKKVEVRKGQNK